MAKRKSKPKKKTIPRKKPKKKTGRPKVKIDEKQVKQLASIGCTHDEIGAVLGCSSKTLQRRFVHLIKEGQERLKASLRRKQYAVAMDGSVGMLIWLGKQYLDQKDQTETKIPEGIDLTIKYADEKKSANQG